MGCFTNTLTFENVQQVACEIVFFSLLTIQPTGIVPQKKKQQKNLPYRFPQCLIFLSHLIVLGHQADFTIRTLQLE